MILEVSGLIDTLQQQSRLVAELKDLAQQQLQALRQDDLKQITNLTEQQEYVSHQLAKLEEQRRQIIAGYAEVIGTNLADINALPPYLNQRDWEKIQNYRDEITRDSQAIQQTNQLNSLLLKQGLKYSEKMLHLLQPRKTQTYGKTGGISTGNGQALVDTNV